MLHVELILLVVAALAIASYCWIVIPRALLPRALRLVAPLVWQALTIGFLAFFQRLMLGGPTKRIPNALIREMTWSDAVSLPYRLRERLLSPLGSTDVDPMARSSGHVTRLTIKAISFVPALALMAIPIVGAAWWSGSWPAPRAWWAHVLSAKSLSALICFMIYVSCCALYELARTWRGVLQTLE